MLVNRLRQVVVVAADLAATVTELQTRFGLGEAYGDPGVAEFGLANGVFPVGDQFLEVVSPIHADTAAGRWMTRAGGDAGYMVIVQVESIVAARAHLSSEGLRTVWSGDLPEISGTHVHPADIGGAIVSFDEARPVGSWHWAGPNWQRNSSTETVTGIAGITMAANDPAALTALRESWARAMNIEIQNDRATLPDASRISFVSSTNDLAAGRSGLVAIDLTTTDPAGSVRRTKSPAPPSASSDRCADQRRSNRTAQDPDGHRPGGRFWPLADGETSGLGDYTGSAGR